MENVLIQWGMFSYSGECSITEITAYPLCPLSDIYIHSDNSYLTSQTLHSILENSLHQLAFFSSMLRMAFLQTALSSDMISITTLETDDEPQKF